MRATVLIDKIKKAPLAKDSFWAVVGNGLGSALLLISGIIIARILGKDLYGEYGVVKTTMLYIGGVAAFGVGTTSTKYIAEHTKESSDYLRSITKISVCITFVFSVLLSAFLYVFAEDLANLMRDERLVVAFRFLGVIVVCKAMSLTIIGILAGHKHFKAIASNNILSGVAMLLLCFPLTWFFGIKGAYTSLLLSQLILMVCCFLYFRKKYEQYPHSNKKFKVKEILYFTFPVMLKELSYYMGNFAMMVILTRFASMGEYAILSVSAQWNAVIAIIPTLLFNVVLSYLSGEKNEAKHKTILHKMLAINFACTLIPCLAVLALLPIIVSFYGKTFVGLQTVMSIGIFSTLFYCVSRVFESNLLSCNHSYLFFGNKLVLDVIRICTCYYVVTLYNGIDAAYNVTVITLLLSILYFMVLFVENKALKN